MGIYSFQASKPLPGIEGGMGVYQNRADYERATVLGHYEAVSGGTPIQDGGFPADSPYMKYKGTGLGLKLRMHPLAAVLILKQLESLDRQNAIINSQVRQINDRICQLPGLSEPVCRKDQDRVYYWGNMLLFDEAKAGMSRVVAAKALRAEGVTVAGWEYPRITSAPSTPTAMVASPGRRAKVLPGTDEVNARAINLALFCQEAPELVEQYVKAFEKVWAHRKQLS